MEVTYNVEDSSLWLDIEVKGDEKSQPESEYDRAISFYKQFTNANITKLRRIKRRVFFWQEL